eukprot:TRINITY_DN2410_c0_g1_i4.p1 TRINITY_DN2410_c0_g1~~TRINITY_DN2410_c0_g1_i4.p1  ORF type:complete len:832 (-),score=229.12 TRINITY_DN2410_c0_g1_i4:113-2608(-)
MCIRDRFYLKREANLERQADDLFGTSLLHSPSPLTLSDDQSQAFENLRDGVEALRKYVLLNYMAVCKIVKKCNKNLRSQIDPLTQLLGHPFYTSNTLVGVMNQCDKLTALETGAPPNPMAHGWVFDEVGANEGSSLLGDTSNGIRQRGASSAASPAGNLPSPDNTLVIALRGCHVDQLLLAQTPNLDALLQAVDREARPASAAAQSTLVHLFGQKSDDADFDTLGSASSLDTDTIKQACNSIERGTTQRVVHLHLNKCLKTNKRDPLPTYEALDTQVENLLQAISASKATWSVMICTDGSATASVGTSQLMTNKPTALLDAKTDSEMDIEAGLGIDEEDEEDNHPPYTWKDWLGMCFRICLLCILMYVFIFGLDLMGASFKVLGGAQAGDLFSAVDNPIAGLMVGVLATVLVQSSSTSTSVVVGMVGSDIITVQTAIPVIMGANIGTSVTNTLVSMGQMGNLDHLERAFAGATVHDCFNFLAVAVMLPLEWATDFLFYLTDWMTSELDGSSGGSFKGPLKHIVSPLTNEWIIPDKKKINKIAEGKLTSDSAGSLIKGGFVEGWSDNAAAAFCLVFSLLFLCLALLGIVKLLQYMVLGKAQHSIKKALAFSKTWWGGYVALLVGCGVTIAVQSSSITTSTLTPLVGVGVITVEQMYPLTLGANVGTTCTAFLAALVSEKKGALQIALCHLMFNIFGILMFFPIPATRLPIPMCKFLGSMTRHIGRGFPLFYLLVAFFIVPVIAFGISFMLTDAGAIGVGFGIVLLIAVVGGVGYFVFWWNYQDGRARTIKFFAKLAPKDAGDADGAHEEIEENQENPASAGLSDKQLADDQL